MCIVISFAGDALICIFCQKSIAWNMSPSSSNKVPIYDTLAALKCAMELKDHYTDTLTTHIGLSCGLMEFTTFGGFNNEYVYMIVGTCINELGACIDDAKSREVVVTDKVYKSIVGELLSNGEHLDTYLLNSGNRFIKSLTTVQPLVLETHNRLFQISNDATLIASLTKFVPYPVVDSLQSSTFRNIAELREVTTMFLKLDTFDPMQMMESIPFLQEFFYMAQGVLAEAGGFLRQFLIDDKGCVLIAMWGTPAFTHTNNCSRALYAASYIALNTKALNHSVSVGITTGAVYCGTVGSHIRRDYVGIGSKVNMAARLMGKAHGRILIEVDTYNRLPLYNRKQLIPTEKLKLKGLDGDTSAYESPIDGNNMPALTSHDDGDGSAQDTLIQADIQTAITKSLNALVVGNRSRSMAVSNVMTNSFALAASGDFTHLSGVSNYNNANIASNVDDESNRDNNNNNNNSAAGIVMSMGSPSHSSPTRDNNSNDLKSSHLVANPNALRYSMSGNSAPSVGLRASQAISEALMSLVARNVTKINPSESGPLTTVSFGSTGGINYSLTPLVLTTLVQGSAGSGKTTCANVFHRAAQSRGLRCIYIRTRNGDNAKPYGIIGKLITDLIGSDELNSEHMQRRSLGALFETLFPGENSSAKIHDTLALRQALGYTWMGEEEAANATGSRVGGADSQNSYSYVAGGGINGGSPDDSMSGKIALTASKKLIRKPKDHKTMDLILTYLLQKTPTAIIITNAHLADELSWMIIKRIVDLQVQLSLFITILTKPSSTGLTTTRITMNKNDNSLMEERGGHGTIRYISNPAFYSLKASRNCSTYDMLPLTSETVTFMLKRVLSTKEDTSSSLVTDDLVQNVLNVSNGNPFWVKSIAEFVNERGTEEFNKSIAAAVISNANASMDQLEDEGSRGAIIGTYTLSNRTEIGKSESNGDQAQQNPLYILVVCRLEKLANDLQHIIKYASIIGQEFDSPTLEAILPKQFLAGIQNSLELLLESSFILAMDTDDNLPVFCFQNYLIRNALYGLTPPSDAAKIHIRIALYLERTFSSNLRNYYNM